MIITERFTINGREFIRTYSDAGRYVVGGSPEGQYNEAIDPANLGRTYTEGELLPPEEQPDRTEEEQALTRYANTLTGANDQTLVEAAETLITEKIKEESS